MKRVMTILAAAVLTSTLLASAAEARSGRGGFGGGGGHMGGLDGGVHMGGGFGGGMGRVGDEHAMQRLSPGYAPGCYYPDEAPKASPWPPTCD